MRFGTSLQLIAMVLGCSLSAICGCQPPGTIPTNSSASSSPAVAEPVRDAASEEGMPTTSVVTDTTGNAASVPMSDAVSVEMVDYEGLLQQVKKLTGKIVVVDVWSTSCPPCMREYPHLVQLSQRWPEQVACVSLNVDYIGIKSKPADSYLPKVKGFLEKEKSVAVKNLMSTEADSDVFEHLKIDSIPAVLLYAADGTLLKTFSEANSGDDGLTYAGDVIPAIEMLLAK
jgi:thiol-disulfide isomerase/thioredoxin